MTFTVRLSRAAPGPVTYDIVSANGEAASGDDFVALELTGQVIPQGQLARTHTLTVKGDTLVEANETLTVRLSNPSGAALVREEGTGRILNDDGLTLSVLDKGLKEGDAGTGQLAVTVRLSQVSAAPVTFTLATAGGTATPGNDYTPLAPTKYTLYSGQTSLSIPIAVSGDTLAEANETFRVSLSDPSIGSVLDPEAIATIYNDDGPTLAINDVVVK
jgi:chitinase